MFISGISQNGRMKAFQIPIPPLKKAKKCFNENFQEKRIPRKVAFALTQVATFLGILFS
jgi:hypothetical protein